MVDVLRIVVRCRARPRKVIAFAFHQPRARQQKSFARNFGQRVHEVCRRDAGNGGNLVREIAATIGEVGHGFGRFRRGGRVVVPGWRSLRMNSAISGPSAIARTGLFHKYAP